PLHQRIPPVMAAARWSHWIRKLFNHPGVRKGSRAAGPRCPFGVEHLEDRTCPSELVTNGGPETGSVSGWTHSGNTVNDLVSTTTPHSGSYAAQLGPVGSLGFLSQDLATIPGTQYTFSWWLNSDGGTPNQFEAFWAGNPVFNQSNIPAQAYQ